MARNPGGYWPLETNANDLSPNHNGGAVNGGVTFGQPGPTRGRQAALFNGVDGYISVPSAASLIVDTQSVAIAQWAKTTGGGSNFPLFINKSDPTDSFGYSLFLRNQNPITSPQFAASFSDGVNGGEYDSPTIAAIDDGNWHLYVAVMDKGSNTVSLYMDAVLKASQIDPTLAGMSLAGATGPLGIGDDPLNVGANSFNGSLAGAFLIVGTALTAWQIKQIYLDQLKGALV